MISTAKPATNVVSRIRFSISGLSALPHGQAKPKTLDRHALARLLGLP